MSGKLLVSVGAEGGAIAIYRDTDHLRYRVIVADQTPTWEEEGGGPAIRRDSGWLGTWSEAIKALDGYPWPHLACVSVNETMAAAVWRPLEDYVRRPGRPVRESAMRRWHEACGITLSQSASQHV